MSAQPRPAGQDFPLISFYEAVFTAFLLTANRKWWKTASIKKKGIMKISILAVAAALMVGQASAQNTWSSGVTTDDRVFAGTTNDSKESFAQWCYSKYDSCVWVLHNGLECNPGESYTALANTKAGAQALTMHCITMGASNDLVVSPFKDVSELANAGGIIGFAFPMKNGRFTVSRFDLTGAPQALSELKTHLLKLKKEKPTLQERL